MKDKEYLSLRLQGSHIHQNMLEKIYIIQHHIAYGVLYSDEHLMIVHRFFPVAKLSL